MLAAPTRTTVLALVLLLSVVLFYVGSYLAHHGHPIDAYASWGASETEPVELGLTTMVKPVCDKTLVYTFWGTAGFGSEYGMFYRAALYAEDEGYALLVDSDPDWVYLNVLEYLLPPKLDCIPPANWRTMEERIDVGKDGWVGARHLRSDRWNGDWQLDFKMGDRYRRPTPSAEEIEALKHHHPPATPILRAEMTLLPAWEQVFVRLSALVRERELWKPTLAITDQINGLVAQHRLKERLSIGVHIRMGDKGNELTDAMEREGGGSLFRQGNLTAYLVAAHEMLPLLEASQPDRKYSLKPLLLVMSDSSNVAVEMQQLGLDEFEVAQLPAPSSSQEKGHVESHFNALPWQDRVQAGEGFVRDVTIVGQVTNGYIGTASSNIARIITLLAGPEKVMKHKLARTLDIPLVFTAGWEDWY